MNGAGIRCRLARHVWSVQTTGLRGQYQWCRRRCGATRYVKGYDDWRPRDVFRGRSVVLALIVGMAWGIVIGVGSVAGNLGL